jgi:hypothetical protein
VDDIHLAQEGSQCRADVNTVMNCRNLLPMKVFELADRLLASREGLCSMEF